MQENPATNTDTKAGTIGGLLLVVLLHIEAGEILKTILLAALGATVSFCVSMGLRWIKRKIKRG